MSYQNYHKHDSMSNILLTDSVATLEDYAKRAVELGQTVLSSCNHGTPGNYRQAYDLAQKYGLKWRYVAEVYFVKDRLAEGLDGLRDRTNCHMILAAKTEKGMYDLNEVISEANISGYYYRPRVDMELLMRLDPRDVFVTTACIAGIWAYGYESTKIETEALHQLKANPKTEWLDTWEDVEKYNKKLESEAAKTTTIWRYKWEEPDRLVRQLHAHFRDSFMLEVQYHPEERQRVINRHILDLYRTDGIPIIAGMDSHFIYPEDKVLRDMRLEANHLVYEDEGNWFMDAPSEDEAIRRFQEQGVLSAAQIREALDNTNVFLTFEDITFDKSRKLPNIFPQLSQEERNEKYRQIIAAQWEKYKQSVPQEEWPRYEAGIEYEVNTITSTNTSDYFLIDYYWMKRAKEKGGLLTLSSRGSASSYFTNTLLGLSSIDRFALPITMYPDRFISADRLKTGSPDIDSNVGNAEVFAEALEEIMGPWHSAPMVAFGTLKRLSAWKMYCRANNVPFDIANELSDRLKEYELDYKHADDDERESLDVRDYVPEKYHEYLKQSEKYLGMIDSISPHPCAYVLCNNDVRREFGIFRINSKTGKKKVVYAAFVDGATADAYGYIKDDILSVDIVKINADIYRRIGIPQPPVPELLKITEGDRATWDMYAKGWTLGLNQTEREKSTEKVMRYKPHNISELSAFVAGIRPGFTSMAPKLFNREHFSYGIPVLDSMLQTKELPESFVLYQEQVMGVLQWAGFAPSESYAAIKAIAKKHPEKVLPMKERFLNGFRERLMREGSASEEDAAKTADMVWQIIEDNTGYSFNACVIGSTRIRQHSGTSVSVKELYDEKEQGLWENKWHVACSMMDTEDSYPFCTNEIIDVRYTGYHPVYCVTCENGTSVVCTDNHKFPVGRASNMVMLKDLTVGDPLFVYRGGRAFQTKIACIESFGWNHVYDVEMAAPNHNFVLDNGLVIGNSHSVSVALDSLYTAWAKAHYPYETYVALLSSYAEKKDKDRIAKAKVEMKKAFGISIVPCRFRQDNRSYFVDKDAHTISDALTSVKGISARVAKELYDMRNNQYDSAVDLFYDLEMSPTFTSATIQTLIRMGYFAEFGSAGKLLHLYTEFRDGENRFSKSHVKATQMKRLDTLRHLEATMPEEDIPLAEQMAFETEYYGTPLSVYPGAKDIYVAVDVDTKYSPKIKMYSVARGTTGLMKIRKPLYECNPLKPGDTFRLVGWDRKPACQFVNGERRPRPGVYDLWIKELEIISDSMAKVG